MILEYATDTRRVWGTYDDGATIAPRAGAALIVFTGDLSGLDRLGELPEGWPEDQPDFRPYVAPVAALANIQSALKAAVDAKAEVLRLTLITPGTGQAMEYQEAYAQAQAALAASGAVKASDYPMLAATIGVDIDPESGKPAADVLGVARSVKTAYEAFLQAGAAIRGARLLAKAEIDAASDVDHAQVIFAAIKWPGLSV